MLYYRQRATEQHVYRDWQDDHGRILRGIVEIAAVSNRFLTEGTVSIQYFGLLRRDPDTIGYQNNVNTLNASPSNLRHMIFIFIYSIEYRSRFGPPYLILIWSSRSAGRCNVATRPAAAQYPDHEK